MNRSGWFVPLLALAMLPMVLTGCLSAAIQQRNAQNQQQAPEGRRPAGAAYELPSMDVEKISASSSGFYGSGDGARIVACQIYNGTVWGLERVHLRGIARDENGNTLWTRRFEVSEFRDINERPLAVLPPLQAVVAHFAYGDGRVPHSLALTPVAAWGWRDDSRRSGNAPEPPAQP